MTRIDHSDREEKDKKRMEMRKKRQEEEMKQKEEKKKQLEEEDKYWEEVWKSNGFDVDHLERPRFDDPGFDIDCTTCDYKYDHRPIFTMFAKIGIHGTKNLQFYCLEKLNCVADDEYFTFHITLLAKDPVDGSCRHFQTSVVYMHCKPKCVACFTARFKPTPQGIEKPGRLHYGPTPDCYERELPEWPPESDFNDEKRFYIVQESELLKHDWIRLYMELAFVEENSGIANPILSELVILKVVVEPMENVEPPNDRLMAGNATFYIRYTYPSIGKKQKRRRHPSIGKKQKRRRHPPRSPPRHRIAIVRRIIKEDSISLQLQSSFTKNKL